MSHLPAAHTPDGLGSPLEEARTFLRNTIAGSPEFGSLWTVVGIESFGAGGLALDLSDGTTIRLDIDRYPQT